MLACIRLGQRNQSVRFDRVGIDFDRFDGPAITASGKRKEGFRDVGRVTVTQDVSEADHD